MTIEAPSNDSDEVSTQEQISAVVQAISERRAVIEQTKGILMFIHGIDADAAFEMLRTQSQQRNVKLRLVAEQMLETLLGFARSDGGGLIGNATAKA